MSKQAKVVPPKPRLGRGLSSLMAGSPAFAAAEQDLSQPEVVQTAVAAVETVSAPTERHSGTPREIPISEIAPNPYQPRREFRPQDLEDLAQSITQQGILQPLIVAAAEHTDAPTPYVLIAGERRLRAAKLVGLATVPCVVRHATRQQMLEWALVENIQRADLNAVERAVAYRDYMDRFNLTQAQIAERLGQARATVANILRMLDLCDAVQKMLLNDQISFGHAKVLAGIVNQPERQVGLAQKVVQEGLSVRQLEGLISNDVTPSAVAGAEKVVKVKPPYLRDLEEQLTQVVGTRVLVVPGRGKHTGRIVVDYYSLEDFDRIAGSLGLKTEV